MDLINATSRALWLRAGMAGRVTAINARYLAEVADDLEVIRTRHYYWQVQVFESEALKYFDGKSKDHMSDEEWLMSMAMVENVGS